MLRWSQPTISLCTTDNAHHAIGMCSRLQGRWGRVLLESFKKYCCFRKQASPFKFDWTCTFPQQQHFSKNSASLLTAHPCMLLMWGSHRQRSTFLLRNDAPQSPVAHLRIICGTWKNCNTMVDTCRDLAGLFWCSFFLYLWLPRNNEVPIQWRLVTSTWGYFIRQAMALPQSSQAKAASHSHWNSLVFQVILKLLLDSPRCSPCDAPHHKSHCGSLHRDLTLGLDHDSAPGELFPVTCCTWRHYASGSVWLIADK